MLVAELEQIPANVQWVTKSALPALVRRMVKPADVVLDIGSGINPQTLVWPRLHICVDAHEEYVQYLTGRLAGSARYLVIQSEWQAALSLLPAGSVDTVFAIDFIEHLSKEDGLRFVAHAQRVARKQVVLFTPLGYFPQSYDDVEETDRWGMHGGYWQTHRSGWMPEDFSAEWKIIGCREYHTEDRRGSLAVPVGSFWAIHTRRGEVSAQRSAVSMQRALRLKNIADRYLPSWCRSALRIMRRNADR
jgi:hypothetical protein